MVVSFVASVHSMPKQMKSDESRSAKDPDPVVPEPSHRNSFTRADRAIYTVRYVRNCERSACETRIGASYYAAGNFSG